MFKLNRSFFLIVILTILSFSMIAFFGCSTPEDNSGGGGTTEEEKPISVPEKDIYVSTDSGDDSSNGEVGTPVKTLSKALTMGNTIYITKGEYSELIKINTTASMIIKGGYTIGGDGTWARANANDRTIISGDIVEIKSDAYNMVGRITIRPKNGVTLENLEIKRGPAGAYTSQGSTWFERYGVVSYGDLTIDNCNIAAMDLGFNKDGFVSGVRNQNDGNLVILSGTIVGLAGSSEAKGGHGVANYGNSVVIKSNVTLVGARDSAKAIEWADGLETWIGTVTIEGGTITGAEGSATTGACGAVNMHGGGDTTHTTNNIRILGGTMIAVKDSATSNWVSAVNYDAGVDGGPTLPNLTISGGTIIASNGRDIQYGAIGVRLQKGKVTISGGTIVGIDNGKTAQARGVQLDGKDVVAAISGGEIVGAQGVSEMSEWFESIFNEGTLTISGTAAIKGAIGPVKAAKGVNGISNEGTLTISGGAIDGAADSVAVTGDVAGIYSGASTTLTITGGTIVGASGIATLKHATGVSTKGALTVSGSSTIKGAIGSVQAANSVFGVNSNGGTLNISGGTIVGSSNDVAVSDSSFGIYNANSGVTTITGGTIISATDDVAITVNANAIFTEASGTVTTISGTNCYIYGVGTNSVTANGIWGINKMSGGKNYKGTTGKSTIENVKDDGSDLWVNSSYWDN